MMAKSRITGDDIGGGVVKIDLHLPIPQLKTDLYIKRVVANPPKVYGCEAGATVEL